MRHAHLIAALAATAPLFAACTTDDIPHRAGPPILEVTSPERGTMESGWASVEVRGIVAPNLDSGAEVTSVTVNGATAAVDVDGNFTALVHLSSGANLIETIAVDADGQQASDTRALVTGDLRPVNTVIENAIAADISAAAFDKLGDVAANLVATSDLSSFVAPFNPVLASGLSNGQEDCLFAKVDVVSGLDVGSATIGMTPTSGGLYLDVDLRNVVVPLRARYAVACITGTDYIWVRASRARIRGTLSVTVSNGAFNVRLLNPVVSFEGFDLDATGLPGTILDMIDIDQLAGDVLAWGVEELIGPMVEDALSGVEVGPQSVSVLGKTLDINVAPAGISFDSVGAELVLDGNVKVRGTDGTRFVYTENQQPQLIRNAGISLGLSDDTVNQLLAGFWAAGGLALTLPQEGGMFDSIALEPLLPPVISPGPDGSLRVVIGDALAHFSSKGQVMVTAALNVEMTVAISPSSVSTGAMQVTLTTPAIQVDIVHNVTGVPDTELDRLFPGVAGFMLEHLSPVLGAIPLPQVAGISITNVRGGTTGGYVTASADIR